MITIKNDRDKRENISYATLQPQLLNLLKWETIEVIHID